VIEMDAASNNSVDDIRELRESVAYAPVSGRRKVYILDEAHMLSQAAWNAFLKTLEEPPPNTVFVLATTEANKVPATVVDRCHRFDFHRPTVEQIATVVGRAARSESIEIPPPAVAALARSATGSFRDALGTLEQLITYSAGEIALDDVLAVLGVADERLLEETVDAVAEGDSRRALTALEGYVQQGRDAASFASDLEVRARALLIVQTLSDVPPELSLTPEADAALKGQAERVDHATVVRLLELLGEAMEAVRAGADPRTRLELALVKSARPELDSSLSALLARIERLERSGLSSPSGEPAAPSPGPPPSGAHPPPGEPATEPARPGEGAEGPSATAPDAGPPPGSPPADEPQPAPGEQLDSIGSLWPAVVELVRGENALLGALIAESHPIAVDGDQLVVGFAATAQFLKKKAEDPANRATIAAALQALTGRRWRLSFELRSPAAAEQGTPSSEGSEEELVRRLMEEFDAEEIPGEWDSPAGSVDEQAGERGVEAATSEEKGA